MISSLQQQNVHDVSKEKMEEVVTSRKHSNTQISLQVPLPASLSEKDGLWTITIPRGMLLSEPIVISTVLNSSLQKAKIVIVVEEEASAVIFETQKSFDQCNDVEQYQHQEVEVHTHRSAKLTYCTLHKTNFTSSSAIVKRGFVAENASLTWVDVLCGGRSTTFDLQTNHQGKAAQSKAFTLYYGTEGQLFEINTQTDHQAELASGLMKARGILADNARVSYRGAVNISSRGGGAVAHQKSETILLGDRAHCDALPVLNVHHDDVICSHGAAMGRFEESALFYLISRGLEEKMAMQLLIESFFQDYLRDVPSQGFICEIQQVLKEKMERSTIK